MSLPMIENPIGQYFCVNGVKKSFSEDTAKDYFLPTDKMIYYESIRVKDGVMLFFEDHMLRLHRSIEAAENFLFDSGRVYEDARILLDDEASPVSDGNLRVVVTCSDVVLHLSDMAFPEEKAYENGVPTVSLQWERESPHVKVFRGDYKAAIAKARNKETAWGLPYEVLLLNQDGKITEGGRSNFFVLLEETVYSPPEDLILIGITRKYVYRAIKEAGFTVEEKLFSLDELIALQEEGKEPVLFLTSSPFDILPIQNVDEKSFPFSNKKPLEKLIKIYQNIISSYIAFHGVDSASADDLFQLL